MEQELPTFPQHLRSPPSSDLCVVGVALSFVFGLVDRCVSFCFGHCIGCHSNYGFSIHDWYLLISDDNVCILTIDLSFI